MDSLSVFLISFLVISLVVIYQMYQASEAKQAALKSRAEFDNMQREVNKQIEDVNSKIIDKRKAYEENKNKVYDLVDRINKRKPPGSSGPSN